MKCKNCSGNLIYQDGLYICESCGSKFSISEFYDNSDVFLLYSENDSSGRRTKSSLIAQDIFQKINNEKINVFFAREDISSLSGEEYEAIYNSAIHSTKVIIVIGTSKGEFNTMLEKYNAFFENKTVFPVYADMDAYDIPNELKSIQSMSYEKIGWQTDLEKALVKALGKESSYDFAEKNIKNLSKKAKTRIILFLSITIILIATVITIVFFTPLVLTSKKYDYAQEQYESGEYVKAITAFYKIKDYKDSKKMLYTIFQKYNGYYRNEDSKMTIHLAISDSLGANIEVIKETETAQVKITESFEVLSTKFNFSFNDSENNQGTGMIEFNDNGFLLTIKTSNKSSNVFFENESIDFFISEKSDKPFAEVLDANTLLSYLKNKSTLGELKRKGLDVEFVSALYRDPRAAMYNIKNTDVYLAIFTYDLTKPCKISDGSGFEYDSYEEVEDPIIFGVSASAQLIIPEYIGKSNNAFVKDDILYVPNGELAQTYHEIDFWVKDENDAKTIETNTNVGFICKSELGAEMFDPLVKEYNAIQY